MSVNIQTANGLKLLADKTTKETIKAALGYTPTNEAILTAHEGNAEKHISSAERAAWNNKPETYDQLKEKPNITDDGSSDFYIADEQGNIIFKVDSTGTHSVNFTSNGKNVVTEDRVDELTKNKSDVGHKHDYNELENKPNITEDDSNTFYITDEAGNIVAKIDEEGIHALNVFVGADNKEVALKEDLTDLSLVISENISKAIENLNKEVENLVATKSDIDHSHDDLTSESEDFTIADNDGNIIAKIDQKGVDAADLLIKGKSVNDIIDEKIGAIPEVDLSNYYTIPENDSLLANKSDITHSHDNLISDSEDFSIADEAGNIIMKVDSTGLHALNLFVGATKDEVALQKNLQEAVNTLNTNINLKASIADVNAALDNKADVEHTHSKLEITDFNHNHAISEITSLESTLAEKANTTYVNEHLNTKSDIHHTHTYNDLTEKPNITDDENGSLQITDESGNIVMEVSNNGLQVANAKVNGSFKIEAEDGGNVELVPSTDTSGVKLRLPDNSGKTLVVGLETSAGLATADDEGILSVTGGLTVATEKYVNDALADINPDNQTVKAGSVTFGASDVVEFKAGDNVTVTGNKSAKTITISAEAEQHPATHPASMITGLSTVATSGSYEDLTDKPVDIVNTEDYILQIRDDAENPIISVTDAGINAHKTLTVNGTNVALKSDLDSYVKTSEKGAANGVATLDANSKIPTAQLPSYVDDVLEYQTKSNFPTTGESGKIYLAIETNKSYRWSGSTYTEIASSIALGETSSTAYAGDKGKANADAIANIKAKLDGIAAGAEVNVQSDWNETNTSSDAYIKNKPTLATVATSGSYNDLTNKPTIPSIDGLATEDYVDEELKNVVTKVEQGSSNNSIKITKGDGTTSTIDTAYVSSPNSADTGIYFASSTMSIVGDYDGQLQYDTTTQTLKNTAAAKGINITGNAATATELNSGDLRFSNNTQGGIKVAAVVNTVSRVVSVAAITGTTSFTGGEGISNLLYQATGTTTLPKDAKNISITAKAASMTVSVESATITFNSSTGVASYRILASAANAMVSGTITYELDETAPAPIFYSNDGTTTTEKELATKDFVTETLESITEGSTDASAVSAALEAHKIATNPHGITAAQVGAYTIDEVTQALASKQNLINASNKVAASNISGLANVATSGSYNDLSNKPTIPTKLSDLTADIDLGTNGALVYKGTLGHNGTITSLPSYPSAETEGHLYTAIEEKEYTFTINSGITTQAITLDVNIGDLVVCTKTTSDQYTWTILNSHDLSLTTLYTDYIYANDEIEISDDSYATTLSPSGINTPSVSSTSITASDFITVGTNNVVAIESGILSVSSKDGGNIVLDANNNDFTINGVTIATTDDLQNYVSVNDANTLSGSTTFEGNVTFTASAKINSENIATEKFVTDKIEEAKLSSESGKPVDLSAYATIDYVNTEIDTHTHDSLLTDADKNKLGSLALSTDAEGNIIFLEAKNSLFASRDFYKISGEGENKTFTSLDNIYAKKTELDNFIAQKTLEGYATIDHVEANYQPKGSYFDLTTSNNVTGNTEFGGNVEFSSQNVIFNCKPTIEGTAIATESFVTEKITEASLSGGTVELFDSTVKLSEDLYTNYNIGRITGASESKSVLLGEKDWTIRQMFENIFTAKAEVPTVTLPSLSLTLSNDSADIEYGKTVKFYATITANTGKFHSSYYSGGSTDSTGVTWSTLNLESTNSTFNSKTSGITAGTRFEFTPSSTYYAVADGGTIKGKATAPSGYTSTGITAMNNLGQETDVKISSDTSAKESSEDSTSVNAGYVPYSYILATSALANGDTLPSKRSKSAYTSIPIDTGDGTTKLYIYIPANKTITEINNNKQAAPFSCDSENLLLKVNNGKETYFKVYHVNAEVASGSNAFTITYA